MKKIRWLTVFLVIVTAFILTAAPVFAAPPLPPPPPYPNVNGIELFAGVDFAGINWGATFTAQAQVPYKGVTYNCLLTASIDYTPDHPLSNGVNTIVGGSFTLSTIQNGKCSVIKGKILKNDGCNYVQWSSGTDYGHVVIPKLTIISATEKFAGVLGGSFDGYDDHIDGPKIFGITVPTITGFLTLN